jgi:alginate O-acetyltransferase complex protein AlgI
MLFNSIEFIAVFLPLVLLGTRSTRGTACLLFIALASTVFYAYTGELWYLAPLFGSAVFDYSMGRLLDRSHDPRLRRLLVCASLTANLGLLAYFKYAALLTSMFAAGGTSGAALALPAGISFYTFQSMSYVIDVYRKQVRAAHSLLEYYAFVAFFPQLVAGPITRYEPLSTQLRALTRRELTPQIARGVFLFCMGLCKKVLLADRIANQIDPLIATIGGQTLLLSWLALVGYGLQIYFDFSGYSDMARGIADMLGVQLPVNFDSPYKAISPRDFWRRWHITLSQWIRDYLYLSVGGNRGTAARVAFNLVLTMGLAGLWHGARWTFLAWGLYHGVLLVAYRAFQTHWDELPGGPRRTLMFALTMLGWVFFRADDFSHATHWFRALIGLNGLVSVASAPLLGLVTFGVLLTQIAPNSNELARAGLPRPGLQIALGVATAGAVILMNYSSTFIYYRF